jgi:hypothetical protein
MTLANSTMPGKREENNGKTRQRQNKKIRGKTRQDTQQLRQEADSKPFEAETFAVPIQSECYRCCMRGEGVRVRVSVRILVLLQTIPIQPIYSSMVELHYLYNTRHNTLRTMVRRR